MRESELRARTAVYSLDDDVLSLTSRAWLCDHAKKTLDIQYYIFSKDRIGLISCDYLVRAADRGVKIRMIIDDATVKSGKKEIQTLDSHENIEIRIYNPGVMMERNLALRLYKWIAQFNRLHRRMHNKTLTVDGVLTITGGRNIADEYYSFDERYNFRDRDVLVAGSALESVKTSFEQFWNHELSVPITELVRYSKKRCEAPDRYDKLHRFACDTSNFSLSMRKLIDDFPKAFAQLEKKGEVVWTGRVNFVSDLPGKNEHKKNRKGGVCTDSMIAVLRAAKSTVDIQSPYIITTDEGKALLRELTGRGVRVRILTNSLGSTDNLEAFSGYQRDREATLETGVEIYEFKPDAQIRYKLMNKEPQAVLSYTPVYGLHSKTMIIDNYVTVIGSYNLDPRSANLNTECVAIIRSEQMAGNMMRFIEEEIRPENAWRITKDFNPDKEAGGKKMIKAASRQVIPKSVL